MLLIGLSLIAFVLLLSMIYYIDEKNKLKREERELGIISNFKSIQREENNLLFNRITELLEKFNDTLNK